jgi:Tfp pilus assembly protein PilX
MKNERGTAMIVVLAFTVLVTALIVANSFVLSGLSRELKRIDRDQQKKFQHPAP